MNQHNSWMATMRKYGSCVLAKFNFILKIASFFGISPCSIEEKSVWKAKSAPFCHSSWFIWVLLVHSGCVYSIWLLINKAKDEFTFFDYFAAFFKDSPTMLDKLTLGWPIIMTYSIVSILALQLGSKGKLLELLKQNHFSYMPKLGKESSIWPLLNKVIL